jgi:iron complex outermembrane recepter protein
MKLRRTLPSTFAVFAVAAVSPVLHAQAAAETESLEEVVVTGTNIRGVAPVGSNLMTLGRAEIEQTGAQTIQQILRSMPAITGIAATPQGGNPGNSFYAPTIHGIGSSSSNATLVLVDGHRISPGSQQQTLTDPNIVPPIMLERVEVLAEGASSTYGSDAVAGVVNFITRKNYEGFTVTGQAGFADGYNSHTAGLLWGTRAADTSIILGFNYSFRSDLAYADRDFLRRNHTAQGGTNFDNFFCSPASVQPAGQATIFLTPTSTTPIVNNAANSVCQDVRSDSILPEEIRQNAMLKMRRSFGSNLDAGLDVVVSSVTNRTPTNRGTLTATVFQTATTNNPYPNPFYVNPPGVTANSQTVRFDADSLLGVAGAEGFNDNKDYYLSGNLEYRFGNDFRLTAMSLFGGERSYVGNTGQLCGSCANLALNGTTNGGGLKNTPAIPGTTTIVEQTLTAANALDVWNVGSANRTSAAVLKTLTDNVTNSRWYYSMAQTRVGVDGTLFNLPGGAVKGAAGIEYVHYGLGIDRTSPSNAGPSSTASQTFLLDLGRNVKSAYAELLVPLIGDDNAKPFLRKLNFSVSARHDDYVGLAKTNNPHFAFGWESFPGITLRGNYSTSFVAPQLTSVGDQTRGGLTTFSAYALSNQTLIVPRASFPLAASVPGASCNATTCTVGTGINGVSVNGGPINPEPGTGQSWSVGFELTPTFVPGFSANIALFNTNLHNQISGSSASNAINSPALNSNLVFYPAGATPAELAAGTFGFPQSTAIPATVYYIISTRQQNLLNLYTRGIDADLRYRLPTEGLGTFRLGASVTHFTKFDQSIKGSPRFSVLNTTGFNNTFPSIQTQGRLNLGWDFGPFSADAFLNIVGSYNNISSTTVTPVTRDANGNPAGGGDEVSGTQILDLHLAYNLNARRFSGSQVYVDASNVLDKDPAFYNIANGYDNYAGNVLGRVVSVGFRLKM